VIDPTGGAGAAGASNPTVVYDGGVAYPVQVLCFSSNLNATFASIITGVAGQRVKILSLYECCTTFTTAGALYLRNSGAGANIFVYAQFTAVGQIAQFSPSGTIAAMSNVGAGVEIVNSGNAVFNGTIVYYMAP
jgi:hypothetical protein